MAEKLTDARVRSAAIKRARYSIMDAKEDGLELRISPNGKRVFALRASVDSRDVRFKIGPYPSFSLEAARERARELKTRLDKEGDFRAADADARRRERERRSFTVGDLADLWLAEQAKHLRASTLSLYTQRLAKHIRPAFGAMALDDVTRAKVRELVNAIGDRGNRRTANTVKTLISALYQFAQNELERECNNPAAGMRAFKEEPRSRAASDAEIKRLWDALESTDLPPGPAICLALKLCILSGQRVGEIIGMRDDELDFDEAVWVVPPERTKSGRGNTVPLTARMIELIKRAQALRSPVHEPGVPVFQSPRAPTKAITRHAVTRGLSRLIGKLDGFEHLTVHDLRRSVRTVLARERLGVSYDDAERLLSHQTGSALSRTYNRFDYAPQKRRTLEQLDAELMRIIEGRPIEPANNVVELRA